MHGVQSGVALLHELNPALYLGQRFGTQARAGDIEVKRHLANVDLLHIWEQGGADAFEFFNIINVLGDDAALLGFFDTAKDQIGEGEFSVLVSLS